MKRLLLLLFLPISIATAELKTADIKGTGKGIGKSNTPGFSCILVDHAEPETLISGIVTVPSEFSPVESAVLMVYDSSGKKVVRTVLGAMSLGDEKLDFEFNLRKDMIENSLVLVSKRDGDDLFVAKYHIGTFKIHTEQAR